VECVQPPSVTTTTAERRGATRREEAPASVAEQHPVAEQHRAAALAAGMAGAVNRVFPLCSGYPGMRR